jgi:hypothetical protein
LEPTEASGRSLSFRIFGCGKRRFPISIFVFSKLLSQHPKIQKIKNQVIFILNPDLSLFCYFRHSLILGIKVRGVRGFSIFIFDFSKPPFPKYFNSFIPCFFNYSSRPHENSNPVCQLATGSGIRLQVGDFTKSRLRRITSEEKHLTISPFADVHPLFPLLLPIQEHWEGR